MTIDWFTVGAQILNFLLLVWLLKRYLYGPILKAIDDRETQTATVIKQADAIKLDVQLQRKMLEKKNNEFDAKRDELLAEARNIAAIESDQIIVKAHINADQISKSRLQALERELEHYQHDIALKTLQEVYEVARKVLADLANVELEQKMFDCFCKRLQNMTPDEENNFNKILEAGDAELLVYSAFELTQKQIEEVDGILQQISSAKPNSHFRLKLEVKTVLITGIEIRSNGWKIYWNTEDYLTVLQTFISQLLTQQRESIHIRTAQLNTQQHNPKDSA